MTIELAGVTVNRGGRTILGPLDWTVHAGERWAIVGPNGSGKTTLLQVVSLYLWPTSGTVDVLGGRFGRIDAREHRRRIGYAGSALEAEMDDELTPTQLVLSARHAALAPWWHVYDDNDRARAAALVERLGIAQVADHPFRTLSSGERRRVSIARALLPDPELLLLDEPAAGLDLGARETLIRDLTALAADERPESIVLVSHHVEEIPPGFGHALVLADGRAVAAGPIEEVMNGDVLGRAYGMPISAERRDGRFWARGAG
ncbi:MAG TPA: ATP-binding cassette domain-containing protein [Candidatus Limnocylindrales bacterium]|nr:ATP-binding cassette domain-containing protein [Candidatus Limnocylindrales bacterium]